MIHLRMKLRATAGSAEKMVVGMARWEVGAPSGFLATTYEQFNPTLSFMDSEPRNCNITTRRSAFQ